ncbi:uncharacterized protein K452DRAFT_313317 [Aplosporella prunicola CBS 121167]|uniref:Uncharacterized protein n=1 Tax=Aplosporella prunicola CBS 121167 TaxID=1176127 RepID=A0A6A6AYF7_9PEZI|nr:uncharacterized protein K452DRAFT_313317 [Aplosporella prunicola CBS 121167]KAF2136288.1 hypothetical protein K452DRAFT_313317 [Aplosporella prunicola CBS 121167]
MSPPQQLQLQLHPRYDPFDSSKPAGGTGVLPPLPNGVSAHNTSKIMRSVVLYAVVPLAVIALVLLSLFFVGRWYAKKNPEAADCSPAALVRKMLRVAWWKVIRKEGKGPTPDFEKDVEAQKGIDEKAGKSETDSFETKSLEAGSLDSKSIDSVSVDSKTTHPKSSIDITSIGIVRIDTRSVEAERLEAKT